MEVYSDRISVNQDEQERLRFSPDDIVKLPVHHAINLWVAQGIPRAGFVAQTLPMEPRYDQELADHHANAQRERGGHHPAPLRDPLAHLNEEADPQPPPGKRAGAKSVAAERGPAKQRPTRRASASALQLPLQEDGADALPDPDE
jgi:hypothetical protein